MALGCILVPVDRWLDVHDELRHFRSELSKRHGFRMHYELKASQLVSRSGAGPWRRLETPMRTRIGIFRSALNTLDALSDSVKTFAIVIPDEDDDKLHSPPVEECWNGVMERLERFCKYEKSHCILMPDDGHPATIRRIARRRRRFAYAPSQFELGTSRRVPFSTLVEDPLHRDSRDSYLVQWADLVAYAAFRRVVPRPDLPQELWEELDQSLLSDVNRNERRKANCDEPVGLIVWPHRKMPTDGP